MEAPTVVLSPTHHTWVNSPYFDGKNRLARSEARASETSTHPKRLWAGSRLKIHLPSEVHLPSSTSINEPPSPSPLREDFKIPAVPRYITDSSPTSLDSPLSLKRPPVKRRLFKSQTAEPILATTQQNSDLALSKLIEVVNKSLDNGVKLELVSNGMGGTYFIRESLGRNSRIVAVFKPRDEEINAPNNPKGNNNGEMNGPGPKAGILIGEGYIRELAAYLLDHEHFAGVPPTTVVKLNQQKQNLKKTSNTITRNTSSNNENRTDLIGSLQLYRDNDSSCEDISASKFPTREVHKIGILDIRLANTDRNEANILISNKKSNHNSNITNSDTIELIPIDHGLVLPSVLNDVWFDWLHWTQTKQPFDLETKDYISRLDPDADCNLLRSIGHFDEASLRNFKICTLFLKNGAAGGLTLFDLGELMSRRSSSEPSALETVIMEAERMSYGAENEHSFFDCLNIQLGLLISNRISKSVAVNCSTM